MSTVRASVHASPNSESEWKQSIQVEVPREFKRLQDAVGQWQGSYTETIESFGPNGGDIPIRTVIEKTDYFYEQAVNGMKLSSTISPSGTEEVMVGNSNYDFSLEKGPSNSAPYITQYSPVAKHRISTSGWLCAAYELCAAKLPELIDGTAGELTAVTPLMNQPKLLRLEFQRKFEDTHKLYSAWAVIDPNFHYAITEYHQQYAWGYKKGTVEYQQGVDDVALPKRVVEEDVDSRGRVAKRYITEFTAPRPCQAKAPDFTFEAFGLEQPASEHKNRYSLITMVNVVVLVAIGFLFSWLAYRSKQKKAAGGP